MGTKRQDIRTLSKRHPKLETLMYRVDKESLIRQHRLQKKDKAPGIDMVTKEAYQENLNENLDDLMQRLKSFSYKPQPVRRVEIDKGNGKKRPLGIPAYEDRLFQGAMADILSDVYEPRFLDCSYGFRPNRKAHDAIKVINDTIMYKKVNYILDCDIKGFFDNVNHEWLMKFLRNDIADPNYLRYIARMLKSGVMIEGKYEDTSVGTPQGGLISPILANVYLHYVLDLWFEKCIKKQFDQEFKQNAVNYCLTHPELSRKECAKNLGIGDSTLYRWKQEAKANNNQATFKGSGNLTEAELENRRLKRELKDTQDALEILKKAISILGE